MSEEERAKDRVVWAAWGLALGLFLLALPWPSRSPPACPAPREQHAEASQTRVVRCDGQGRPLRGPARLLFGQRLDPNDASAESLQALPGIGPVRAAAIVAARDRRPFHSVSDLRRVHGIGPVTLSRIAPWLEIGRPGSRGARLQQNR